MRKTVAVLAVAALVISLAAPAFATGAQMGTIKSVDAKAGTVVFYAEGGKDVTLKADKSIDLDKIKAGDKVDISVENDMLKSVKAEHVNWCPKGY
jgi:Cu/Ag efflux protein CusF